ncbi:hypothetical protein NDU88_002905 [Pleurodeles waltl]|uniref:Uncharacterized protein n=1 Tax=Pleurodeles waltl TaxID=8319 RepID=A0AAV7M7B6_PLEWA|nr:hypothetical protein NDU88_002905 [Pleurodeles waltl]
MGSSASPSDREGQRSLMTSSRCATAPGDPANFLRQTILIFNLCYMPKKPTLNPLTPKMLRNSGKVQEEAVRRREEVTSLRQGEPARDAAVVAILRTDALLRATVRGGGCSLTGREKL